MIGARARAAFFAFSAVLAGGAIAEEPRHTSFTLAREAAQENAETPAGRRYEVAFLSSLDRWLPPVVQRCAKGIPDEERIGFEAVVRVGRSGEPEEVLVAPETAVARCVAPELTAAKYPAPPQPSWWMRVEVQLK